MNSGRCSCKKKKNKGLWKAQCVSDCLCHFHTASRASNGTEDSWSPLFLLAWLLLQCQATFSCVIVTESDVDGIVRGITRQGIWEHIEMERQAHHEHRASQANIQRSLFDKVTRWSCGFVPVGIDCTLWAAVKRCCFINAAWFVFTHTACEFTGMCVRA